MPIPRSVRRVFIAARTSRSIRVASRSAGDTVGVGVGVGVAVGVPPPLPAPSDPEEPDDGVGLGVGVVAGVGVAPSEGSSPLSWSPTRPPTAIAVRMMTARIPSATLLTIVGSFPRAVH
ncbi:hypothetical protein BRC93_16010 [Halobacteriales archaeon QS_5_70_15]|nr:MAG: hypothetical protein BRC93_16010 [Halobacteriales archaeon QS_5_70_15]